jgi:cephalosporin hydroxylase
MFDLADALGSYADAFSARKVLMAIDEDSVIRNFHELYYTAVHQTWRNTFWFGTLVEKCPLDLWVYQEIIHECRPELIIETGTMEGGSALYMASLLDLQGQGEVITIDIESKPWRPMHPRVTYITGSSTDPGVVSKIADRVERKRSIMVVLDSDHAMDHVLKELRLYAPFVSPGGFLIVEDTNVNGNPVGSAHGPGPWEAVEEFLERDNSFEVDRSREKFFMTFNPGGYLRKRLS